MVHGIKRGGGAYNAQWSCNSIAIVLGIAGVGGRCKDDSLVHNGFEVNVYLVQANP